MFSTQTNCRLTAADKCKRKGEFEVYQVFDRPLVLINLPQSLIISLHLVDILSQVLGSTHTQMHVMCWVRFVRRQ